MESDLENWFLWKQTEILKVERYEQFNLCQRGRYTMGLGPTDLSHLKIFLGMNMSKGSFTETRPKSLLDAIFTCF